MVRRLVLKSAALDQVSGGADDDFGIPAPDYPTEAPTFDVQPSDYTGGPSEADIQQTQADIAQNYQDLASPSPSAEPAYHPPAEPTLANVEHLQPPQEFGQQFGPQQYAPQPPTFNLSPSDYTGGPSEADILRNRIDIAQNYEDAASPGRLNQGNVGDCFIVSTLNDVNRTPDGQAHLASRITDLGDGFHQVSLNDRYGQPQNILVQDPTPGVGSTGDQNLRLFERAFAVSNTPDLGGTTDRELYANINHGGWPSSAMAQLGLSSNYNGGSPAEYNPAQAITTYEGNGGTVNGVTMTLNSLGVPEHPSTGDEIRAANAQRDLMSQYNILGPHAYEVAMTYRDPGTNEPMAVLRNPHGFNQPLPIPQSQLGSLFSSFSYGRVR